MADIKSPQARSKNMAAIKSKDTKPELAIRKALYARGFRYRIAYKNIIGHPDIYVLNHNVAIFVNGCFWHRHKQCKFAYVPKSRIHFWEAKFQKNMERDLLVSSELAKKGIRQCVIWECEIKRAIKDDTSFDKLISEISKFVESDQKYREFGTIQK